MQVILKFWPKRRLLKKEGQLETRNNCFTCQNAFFPVLTNLQYASSCWGSTDTGAAVSPTVQKWSYTIRDKSAHQGRNREYELWPRDPTGTNLNRPGTWPPLVCTWELCSPLSSTFWNRLRSRHLCGGGYDINLKLWFIFLSVLPVQPAKLSNGFIFSTSSLLGTWYYNFSHYSTAAVALVLMRFWGRKTKTGFLQRCKLYIVHSDDCHNLNL